MGGMKGYPFLADKGFCSDRSKAFAKTVGHPFGHERDEIVTTVNREQTA